MRWGSYGAGRRRNDPVNRAARCCADRASGPIERQGGQSVKVRESATERFSRRIPACHGGVLFATGLRNSRRGSAAASGRGFARFPATGLTGHCVQRQSIICSVAHQEAAQRPASAAGAAVASASIPPTLRCVEPRADAPRTTSAASASMLV